jgi:methylenetetrahydrofolate reductase (NADPH)
VVQLCEKLIALGAPGFHFYILNQAQPTLDILEYLGVKSLAVQTRPG